MHASTRRRWRSGLILSIVLALAAMALAGCERVSQSEPAAGSEAASIVATDDFGAEVLLDVRVPPDQTLLRSLRGATQVRTTYGGGFVAEMLGRESDVGARRDWFFWVDGVLGDVGANQTRLRTDEQAWWDYHSWATVRDPYAVVGQWPRPFAERRVNADSPLAGPLADAGATVETEPRPWRVRVGSESDLDRREPAWRAAGEAPADAGLYARIEDDQVLMVGPDGAWASVAEGRALAAAVPSGGAPSDGVLMVVSGTDRAAAEAAAHTIATRPEVLRLRVAVAFDGRGEPIRAVGRDGP